MLLELLVLYGVSFCVGVCCGIQCGGEVCCLLRMQCIYGRKDIEVGRPRSGLCYVYGIWSNCGGVYIFFCIGEHGCVIVQCSLGGLLCCHRVGRQVDV